MRLLIGTSWKMNLTSSEARRYCDTLVSLVGDVDDRDLFVLPPFTSIWVARECLSGSRVRWGAQHVHPDDSGAHTGDISAPMLADLGCSYVEVGHSERRRDYGETDAFVAAQVSAIQRRGMTAIVCVGETARGTPAEAVVAISRRLAGLGEADPERLVIAYEPVWAIGVGAEAAEPEWVGTIHAEIRERLDGLGLGSARTIYGGGVDTGNAPRILAQPSVDGLFVGRSALDPTAFANIARTESHPPLEPSRPTATRGGT